MVFVGLILQLSLCFYFLIIALRQQILSPTLSTKAEFCCLFFPSLDWNINSQENMLFTQSFIYFLQLCSLIVRIQEASMNQQVTSYYVCIYGEIQPFISDTFRANILILLLLSS